MSYKVKLDIFEGPLDLLLFFIKRDEINIYDIPISYITKEYLEYLDVMTQMNLHLAGEFVNIASLLIRIKVRMLLPSQQVEDSEELEDPRTELVQMLVEYRKYKEVSSILKKIEDDQLNLYYVTAKTDNDEIDPDIFLSDIDLLDLGLIFNKLLKNIPKPSYYNIQDSKINIPTQMQYLKSLFIEKKKIKFSEISTHIEDRIELIVTFLAILEMIKSRFITVSQKTIFGDFWLNKNKEETFNVIQNS